MTAPSTDDWMTNPASARAVRAEVRRDFPEAFGPFTTDPALPCVLLIGDSISLGYTPHVRRELVGVAGVHRIPDNGGATSLALAMLDEWLGDGRWDLIHFNFGLHDVTQVGDGRVRTPVDAYETHLRRIVSRLCATGARLIFSTSTPVPGITQNPTRDERDVVAFNARAVAVMHDFGVSVNNLHAIAVVRLPELQRPANVHFQPRGYEVLGASVAAAIRSGLLLPAPKTDAVPGPAR